MPLIWDNVTEIKWNIFGRVWFFLKKNFFSNVYISVNTIFDDFFVENLGFFFRS